MSRRSMYPLVRSRRWSTALALVATSSLPFAAHGEVRVVGGSMAVHVTAGREDSVADVLSALGARFNLRYRSAIKLDEAANSTYTGPLDRVIANLLDGFNYIVKRGRDSTEVVIFGRHGEVGIAPPAEPPSPTGILSRWR